MDVSTATQRLHKATDASSYVVEYFATIDILGNRREAVVYKRYYTKEQTQNNMVKFCRQFKATVSGIYAELR